MELSSLFNFYILVLIAAFRRSVLGDFQTAVMQKHNTHRTNAGLTPLTWSTSLATKAQEHTDSITTDATSCNMQHSSGEFRSDGQGENIYMASGAKTDEEHGLGASTVWYSEISKYKYPLLTDPVSKWDFCVDWTKVGHFSQMMWADTTEIGCGVGQCVFNGNTFVTCHYLPAGNMRGSSMFAEANYNQLIASGEELARCSACKRNLNWFAALFVVAASLTKFNMWR